MDYERELRRHQNTLIIIGLGVIAFGIWSIIKMVMLLLLAPDTLFELMAPKTETEVSKQTMMIIVVSLVAFFLLIDLALRLYVGRSAIREARTGKKRITYLIIAGLIAALNASSLSTPFIYGTQYYLSGLDMVVTFLIDLTSFIVLIELIRSGVKVRQLRKEA